MKLNKKLVRWILIILLIFNLFFFSFLLISKKITTKSFIKECTINFDFKEYLLNDDVISNGIRNYNYPKEVFDYIDNNQILNIKNKYIDNLTIDKDLVKEVLINSFYEYESRTNYEIKDNLDNDIELFSNNFSYKFNNFSNIINFLSKVSNSLYSISLFCLLLILMILIIIEKKNLLNISIFMLCYSFILYYLSYNFFKITNSFKYIKNININLEKEYIICFIFSFVLLLIYVIYYLKKFLRDQRIKGYYKEGL